MNSRPGMLPVERFFHFALLGLLATGFLALFLSHGLDSAVFGIAAATILARGAMVVGMRPTPVPARVLMGAALGCIIFYPIDYYLISHDFLAATIHAFCLMAAARILTASRGKDYAYVGAISFVELAGGALLSFRPGFFACLALYVLFATAALSSWETLRGLRGSPPGLSRRVAGLSVLAACAVLVFTAGLFLMVPRTARAAARFLPRSRITGFSSSVDLGSFGSIAKDGEPVMHVVSYKHRLPDGLKWRGASLSRFDGRRWWEPPVMGFSPPSKSGTVEVADQMQRSRRDGTRLLYRVDVDTSDRGVLFIAGTPEFINVASRRLIRIRSDSFRATRGNEPLSYEVSAHQGAPPHAALDADEQARYLDLPALDPRIPELAKVWAGDQRSSIEQAKALEEHLRGDFVYTIETNHAAYGDPLAHFLFTERRGYCEYFASAMAVMLRTLHIPSRVATGFQSGFYNEVSGQTVIRASDAHAWVEAWFPGQGWITFDPTPYASEVNSSVAGQMEMYLDAASGVWRKWVLEYDPEHQTALAAHIAGALRTWPNKLSFEKPWRFLALIALIAALWLLVPRLRWRRRANERNDVSRHYRRMLIRLEREGYRRAASATPHEFAQSLPADRREAFTQLTALYNAARFGGDGGAARQFISSRWNSLRP